MNFRQSPNIFCAVTLCFYQLNQKSLAFLQSSHLKQPFCWIQNDAQKNLSVKPSFTVSKKNLGDDLGEVVDYDDDTLENDIDDSEKDLVLSFLEMVQSSPPGTLLNDEIDLLRAVMVDFPTTQVESCDRAQTVESLLYRILSEWDFAVQNSDSEKEKAFQPMSSDFSAAVTAWERSSNPDKVLHVLSILSDQRELFVNGLSSVKPELKIMNTILEILDKSRERGIDKRASQIFESLSDFGLLPDPDTYRFTVKIIAKSRTRGAAQRAENFLRDAVKHFPPQMIDGKAVGIGVDAFNDVVTAYAKGNGVDGPEKAEQFIVFMDQIDAENGSLGICRPNVNTFTSLIDSYAQRNDWESVCQADRILSRLLEQHLEGNDDLEPNVATWTIVISAWARLSKKNRRGAAERAGKLLKRMEDLYEDGRTSAKPDAITYVTCMNAFAFSKHKEDKKEAERLLDEMNELYLDGDNSMKPSARSVNVLVESWIKTGEMEKAEDLLDRYENLLVGGDSPDSKIVNKIYRSMLFGYAQQGNTERARVYLDYMFEKGMTPDCMCFDRIIEANTRIPGPGSMKSSLEIFELLESCRQSGAIRPDERVYTTFIRALTKGRVHGLHKKSELLLKRMHMLYEEGNEGIKPTVFAYNAVLNACAECLHVEGSTHGEAFKTALQVFNELRNGKERPDQVTFGNMLRCAMLLPKGDQRNKFVSATFRLCCEQGYFNNFVLRDLQLAAPEKLWRSLLELPIGEVDIELLPSKWSYRIARITHNERKKNLW